MRALFGIETLKPKIQICAKFLLGRAEWFSHRENICVAAKV